MPQPTDNADRDFSADATDESPAALRLLLKCDDVADIFDAAVRERIGRIIGRAGRDPTKARSKARC